MPSTALFSELFAVPASGRARRCWRYILIAAVLLGVGFRLAQYLSARSYWHDEAFLVLNVFQKDAQGLMGRLDAVEQSPQAAPPLFLLTQRAVYLLLGGSEYAMRLIPLLLGVGALLLMAWVAWRRLPPVGAVLATGLFALSDRIIWHASEAKQYSGDLFFAIVLLAVALSHRPRTPEKRLAACSLLAAVFVWMSYPVVFVFGGISLAMLPQAWRRRRLPAWMAANLPAVVSFAWLYLGFIRIQQNTALNQYWADRFLDWHDPLSWPAWFVTHFGKLFDYPYTDFGWLLILLGILGSIHLWRHQRRHEMILLFSPIGLVLAAAAAHAYPFGGHRLTLFLAGSIFWGAGWGVVFLVESLPFRRKIAVAGLGLAAIALVAGLAPDVVYLFAPRTRDHLRPAVAFVRQHHRKGDGMIVLNSAELLCYWRTPPEPWVAISELDTTVVIPADWDRFWIIGNITDREDRARWTPWLRVARSIAGGPQLSYQTQPAQAMLFDRPSIP